jgi:hypothetical protein
MVNSRKPPWRDITRGILAYRRWQARNCTCEADMVDLMVQACVAADKAGRPFCRHGSLAVSNIHSRRAELPPPLCYLTKKRLYRLAATAIRDGRLIRGTRGTHGALHAP